MEEYFVVRIIVNIYYSADVRVQEVIMINTIRKNGEWMVNSDLTRRLNDERVIVVDGTIIDHPDNGADLNDFIEVVETVFGSQDPIAWLLGGSGSCLDFDESGCVIYVGSDVPDDVKVFVMYHEYKHYLDFVGLGVVPSDEHSSVRSSRIEKICDLYALRRVVREMGTKAAEKAIEWMINYHFQWDVEHPNDPSDLLYRAILLYRFCRQNGLSIDPVVNMKKLQKSKRWWR